jgi:hypothetical protein
MKRSADSSKSDPKPAKRIKPDDYCSVEQKRDTNGNPIWPAAVDQILAAQAFLKEW